MIDWKDFFCGNTYNRLLVGYFLSKYKNFKFALPAIKNII